MPGKSPDPRTARGGRGDQGAIAPIPGVSSGSPIAERTRRHTVECVTCRKSVESALSAPFAMAVAMYGINEAGYVCDKCDAIICAACFAAAAMSRNTLSLEHGNCGGTLRPR